MKDPFTSKIRLATSLPTILPRTPRGIRNERWSFILISIKCKYLTVGTNVYSYFELFRWLVVIKLFEGTRDITGDVVQHNDHFLSQFHMIMQKCILISRNDAKLAAIILQFINIRFF